MTFEELIKRAQGLSRREMTEELRQLGQETRMAAVIRLLLDHEADWTRDVASQPMADSYGRLAHCAGSLEGVRRFKASLGAALAGRRKQTSGIAEAAPEPDDVG